MKYFYYPFALLLFISCSLLDEGEEEEFDYYEPIIGEEFQTVADFNKKVEYQYSPERDLVVETSDENGIKYTLHIPPNATGPGFYDNFDGYIAPLTSIQNLPENAEFVFGVEVEPYGIQFIKPVKITIDLPGEIATKDLLGFYNEGIGGMAYLEPMKIKRSSGKIQAIFEVLHFSSYGGVIYSGTDYNCPDPRGAQSCENLREIVGCVLGAYEVGINEELSQQDKDAVNHLLRAWMEEQLKYADHSETDFSDIYEFEYELSQYLCWKAMTQEFNSYPEGVFSDLFNQAEEYIIKAFGEVMGELNDLCIDDLIDEDCLIGAAAQYTNSYLQWLVIAQQLGIEDDPAIIDLFDFCNGSVRNILINFSIVQAGTLTEFDRSSNGSDNYKLYVLEIEFLDHIISVDYLMTNLLEEVVNIEESEIEWVDVSQFGLSAKGNFEYNNGTISMNSGLKTAIRECQQGNPDCDFYGGDFEVYKNGCYMASVYVYWTRN